MADTDKKRGRGRPSRTKRVPSWYGPFLGALAQGHTVIFAAEQAKVTPMAAYKARAGDPAFADAWQVALEASTQVAEEELFNRAVHGVDKPVYWQGVQIDTVKEKSDTLLQFLLKSRRPIYRESVQMEMSGTVGHEISMLEGKQPIEIDAVARREAAKLLLLGEGDGA